MKAEIKEAVFEKEFDYQGRKLFNHKIVFIDPESNEIIAQYTSTKKEQDKFVAGKETEFNLTDSVRNGKKYYKIKPAYQGGGNQNYNREKKREQTRYSGFSASYVKDLIGLGILKPEITEAEIEHNNAVLLTWRKRSKEMFDHMVLIDKQFES